MRPGLLLALAAAILGCGSGGGAADASGARVGIELHLQPRTTAPLGSMPLDISMAGLQLDADYPDGPWQRLAVVRRRADPVAAPVMVASGAVAPGRYARVTVEAVASRAVIQGGSAMAVDSHVEPIALPLELVDGDDVTIAFELTLLDDPVGGTTPILLTRSAVAGQSRPGDASSLSTDTSD